MRMNMKINMSIKSKSKISASKGKKAKTSKPIYSVSSPEEIKIISGFEKRIIKDLYGFASKGESKGTITLVEAEYPKEYEANIKILDKLKKQKIIKRYRVLKPEEVEFQPTKPRKPRKLEIEVNPDLLFQQTSKDYDYYYLRNALLEFNLRKIINYYKKINLKEIIEGGFKYERILTCNGLKLGLESGNAIYEEAVANFMPDREEYKLLKALMEQSNRRLSYENSCKIIFGAKRWNPQGANTTIKRDISFIVRNIKRKLKIVGKGAKNKDLFTCHNGYRIVCRQKN